MLLDRTAGLAGDYLTRLATRRAGAITNYEDTVTRLGGGLPQQGTDALAVVEQLASVLGPATVASAGPRYFGLVVGGSLPAALCADWLVSAWDQTAYSRVSSPAGAAIEEVAERWVIEALGLPTTAAVGFVTGATAGNLVGLLAARHTLLARRGWAVEEDGLFNAPPVRVLVGEEVHPSVLSALRISGLGAARVERVPVDDQGAMRAESLEVMLAANVEPVVVCAQVGNVNSGSCDPIAQIVNLTHACDGWVHVDGAFGLWAAASPQYRGLVAGVERADSWATDAHKWLNVPYDCGLAIVAEPNATKAALHASTSYLTASDGREPGDRVLEMSRRARAVPVYAALRSLGREGLSKLVEDCCHHARRLAATMAAVEGVTVLNAVVLNQVLLRFIDDATTYRVIDQVQRGGEVWLGPTVWQGNAAARVSFSNWSTNEADVDRLSAVLTHSLAEVRAGTMKVD